MPGFRPTARRWIALAAATACLVLIAPPATAGCCAKDCDEVCCLLVARAGLGLHHHHPGGEGGARWTAPSPGDHCAAACPAPGAARAAEVAPDDDDGSPVPDAGRIPAGFEDPPEPARPARTADPRGPPPSTPIAV